MASRTMRITGSFCTGVICAKHASRSAGAARSQTGAATRTRHPPHETWCGASRRQARRPAAERANQMSDTQATQRSSEPRSYRICSRCKYKYRPHVAQTRSSVQSPNQCAGNDEQGYPLKKIPISLRTSWFKLTWKIVGISGIDPERFAFTKCYTTFCPTPKLA